MRGEERTRGIKFIRGIDVFWGFSEIFCPSPKKNYVGATKNNTGGYLKIRETRKNSNMRGHTKFLGGLKK